MSCLFAMVLMFLAVFRGELNEGTSRPYHFPIDINTTPSLSMKGYPVEFILGSVIITT